MCSFPGCLHTEMVLTCYCQDNDPCGEQDERLSVIVVIWSLFVDFGRWTYQIFPELSVKYLYKSHTDMLNVYQKKKTILKTKTRWLGQKFEGIIFKITTFTHDLFVYDETDDRMFFFFLANFMTLQVKKLATLYRFRDL